MRATKLFIILSLRVDAILAFISTISKPHNQVNRATTTSTRTKSHTGGIYHEVEKYGLLKSQDHFNKDEILTIDGFAYSDLNDQIIETSLIDQALKMTNMLNEKTKYMAC